MIEQFSPENRAPHARFDVSDYEDEPFYPLLRTLAPELAHRAVEHIEDNDMTDQEAVTYLEELVEKRRQAKTETHISDLTLQESLDAEFFKHLENELFDDTERQIGHGRTAKVHVTSLESESEKRPIAVKYLISPIKGTLRAAEEHDMLREVERLEMVERMEHELNSVSQRIKVPHPYFHHQTAKIECYGMERIDGCNLEEGANGVIKQDVLDKLLEQKIDQIDIASIEAEIDAFYAIMHSYCLHGDIKPANLMVDSNGTLYVIDFGQSILAHDIPEKAAEQFDNLAADEIQGTKYAFRQFVTKLKALREETNAKTD